MTEQDRTVAGDPHPDQTVNPADGQDVQSRRDFLIGLGKWSQAVIVGAVVGGMAVVSKPVEAGWLNRRGSGAGWVNGKGGGGSWANRRGGARGGSWVNRR